LEKNWPCSFLDFSLKGAKIQKNHKFPISIKNGKKAHITVVVKELKMERKHQFSAQNLVNLTKNQNHLPRNSAKNAL
jgi:hypothetical protein